MPIVCGIQFRGTGKIYDFAVADEQDLQIDDRVIVETSRGPEMGRVAVAQHEISDDEVVGELKPVMRRAATADLLEAQHYQAKEADAMKTCKERVARFGLPMKITSAEYSFDGSRLTFFFTAQQRVDFRELVRELARTFRTRIELRQIGVRDEARILGGLGKCGRPLCCRTWLSDFCPISIRMAKAQDLSLNPLEISGLCGRLLCCLSYEADHYKAVKSQFPKVGKHIDTPLGTGRVTKVSALKETATVLFEDGSTVDLTVRQLVGEDPLEEPCAGHTLTEGQKAALGNALGGEPTGTSSGSPEEARTRSDGDRRPRSRPSRSRRPRQSSGNGSRGSSDSGTSDRNRAKSAQHTDRSSTTGRGQSGSNQANSSTQRNGERPPPRSKRRRSGRFRRRSRTPRHQTSTPASSDSAGEQDR